MASFMLKLAATAACAFVLACDSGDSEAESLENRTFLSQRVLEGGAPRDLVEGTQLELQFHDSPTMSAEAGCNPFGGSFAIEDGAFVVKETGTGLIGCDADQHDQDEWYFGFLLTRPAIEIDGDSLVLDGSGIRIEYLDQEAATPDAELVGVTWTVETIIEGDIAQFTVWPAPATLVFEADGTVSVNTGCNSGSGTYQVSGTELTFADVAVSERGCEGDIGVLESAVLGVLHGPQPITWEITVDRLSLRGETHGLDLVASKG